MNSTLCFSLGTTLGVIVGIVVLSPGRVSDPEPMSALGELHLVTEPEPSSVPLGKRVTVGTDVAHKGAIASNASPLVLAREAALRGEVEKVRQLLEAKVRRGDASRDEARLVRQACKAMGDRVCANDIKSKYPAG